MTNLNFKDNVAYYKNFRVEKTENGFVIYWDYANNDYRKSRNLDFLLELADERLEK